MDQNNKVLKNMMRRANFGDQLRRHARTRGEKPHIIGYDIKGRRRVYSYEEINRLSCRVANALSKLGIGKGDVVAVMSHNSPNYAITWFGCCKIGAKLTGINFMYRGEEIEYQVNHSDAKLLMVEEGLVNRFESLKEKFPHIKNYICINASERINYSGWVNFDELISDNQTEDEPQVEISDDDPALLVYTSGTEARPKGVLIPHRNYFSSTALSFFLDVRVRQEEKYLFTMPFYTVSGIGTLTTLTIAGATTILPYQVDASLALNILKDEKITMCSQTPTFFLKLMQEPGFEEADVKSLRTCITYGGLMSRQILETWSKKAPEIVWGTYWGQAELSQLGTVGWFRTLEEIPEMDPSWIGKPVSTLEIKVVDENGKRVNPGEVGELICRSPSAMLGYYKDPDKTEEVCRGGWVHTGDLVRIDSEGNLFFFDRKKDMIKTGGVNVSSFEVEDVLYRHNDVAEVAVVGIPDDYWSEIIVAVIVPKPGREIREETIKIFCQEKMAPFKIPKRTYIVKQLPRDAQGKILKRELRKTLSKTN
jgi:acyl-CoA synthetase (AMP-forming)/AMP-acid ligase II